VYLKVDDSLLAIILQNIPFSKPEGLITKFSSSYDIFACHTENVSLYRGHQKYILWKFIDLAF